MSSFSSLVKIEVTQSLSGLYSRKNNQSRPNAPAFILGFLFLLFIAISFGYGTMSVFIFKDVGAPMSGIIILFGGLACMLTFVTSINRARGIYIGRDYDLLTALPIKRSDIVGAKIFSFYLIEMLFSFIVMVPCGICLAAFAQEIVLMFVCFLLALFIPIVPIVVASILSLLLTLVTARFKYGNIITALLYIPFVIAMSLMGYFMGRSDAQAFQNMGAAFKWFNPSLLLVELAFNQSYLFLLVFVGANLAMLAVTILLFVLLFDKLHAIVSSVRMKNGYVRKELKNKKEFGMLLSMEFKRLFNSKVYLANSALGAVMGIVAAILLLVSTRGIGADNPDARAVFERIILPIAIASVIFSFSISNPTCSSISMEGNNFWLIKTLPISMRKYMHAKLLLTYILYIPASLIASTIIVIFHHESVTGCVMAYVLPILAILLGAIIGLLFNLKHPKFKWQSENEVVKNSVAVLFTMLVNVLLSLVLAGILIPLTFLNPVAPYFIALGLLVLLLCIFYPILRKNFARCIDKMEDL